MDNLKNSERKEQKKAVFVVWTIISVTTTIIILLPFFVNKQTVLQNTPTCISKSQFNIECSLCGMTKAFIEISNGKISHAYVLNKGSVFVYSSFLLNIIIYVAYVIYKTKLKKQTTYIDDT